VPIATDRPYGVDILYDTAHRFYSWTVNGNRQIAAKMPDDYPLIGTKVIGSSFSSSGRNTVYAVDNVKWVELSAGTPYTFFTTTGQPLNLATTSDPANPPPVVPGSYNLEELMNASGSGTPAPAPGYDGLAIMSNDTHTLFVAAGDYGLVDSTGADSIMPDLATFRSAVQPAIRSSAAPVSISSTAISAINRSSVVPLATARSGGAAPAIRS
jgi:hypothetical protein